MSENPELKPPLHVEREKKLLRKLGAVIDDQCLTPLGKAMIAGTEGETRFRRTMAAPKTGWIEGGSEFLMDRQGCIRKIKVRFYRDDHGVKREITRIIGITKNGELTDAGPPNP